MARLLDNQTGHPLVVTPLERHKTCQLILNGLGPPRFLKESLLSYKPDIQQAIRDKTKEFLKQAFPEVNKAVSPAESRKDVITISNSDDSPPKPKSNSPTTPSKKRSLDAALLQDTPSKKACVLRNAPQCETPPQTPVTQGANSGTQRPPLPTPPPPKPSSSSQIPQNMLTPSHKVTPPNPASGAPSPASQNLIVSLKLRKLPTLPELDQPASDPPTPTHTVSLPTISTPPAAPPPPCQTQVHLRPRKTPQPLLYQPRTYRIFPSMYLVSHRLNSTDSRITGRKVPALQKVRGF